MTHTIRSYVLRQGRISNAQRRACETLLPEYGVPFNQRQVDLETVFGRKAPKILEIGFGMGESTAAIADAHPEFDYLAIDVHNPGVGSLLSQIESRRLTNIRIIRHDVVEVMKYMLPLESLDGVHIFFPDPWPKSKHHKRRLIQPLFISNLCRYMKYGAYLHIATDWKDYADRILEVLTSQPLLSNTANDFVDRPECRPLTKFERRGINQGHAVWDMIFRRCNISTQLSKKP